MLLITYILPVVEPLFPLCDVWLEVDEEGGVEEEQARHQVLVHCQPGTLQGAAHKRHSVSQGALQGAVHKRNSVSQGALQGAAHKRHSVNWGHRRALHIRGMLSGGRALRIRCILSAGGTAGRCE